MVFEICFNISFENEDCELRLGTTYIHHKNNPYDEYPQQKYVVEQCMRGLCVLSNDRSNDTFEFPAQLKMKTKQLHAAYKKQRSQKSLLKSRPCHLTPSSEDRYLETRPSLRAISFAATSLPTKASNVG